MCLQVGHGVVRVNRWGWYLDALIVRRGMACFFMVLCLALGILYSRDAATLRFRKTLYTLADLLFNKYFF